MIGKQILNELAPYQQGKQIKDIKKQYNLDHVVKLASNENPYGYSLNLEEGLVSTIKEANIYPDGHSTELRTMIANKLKINESKLVFGSGSDEIIQLICRAFLHDTTNTVMAMHTFPQYKQHALIEGATVKDIPMKNGYHDLARMFKAIDEQTKVVWICAPDNPTGTMIPQKQFYEFMDACPTDVLVVLDEAYYEYVGEHSDLDALDHLEKYKNLVLLRTFSKAYGLAGLRMGYGIMSEKIASKLNIVRGPFNTSIIAQKAAVLALKDQAFLEDTVNKNETVKQSFKNFLNDIDWSYYDSETNFILVSTPINGNKVAEFLLENGFIVRSGELLGHPHTIRVTIGTDEEMNELQHVLTTLDEQINKEV